MSKNKTPQIRVANSAASKILFKKILRGLGVAVASVAILYLCFAVTIIRVVPTTSTGFVPVKNATFEGGKVPVGREILVDVRNPQGSGIIDRAKQSFIPNADAARVLVLAGDIGKLSWAPPSILMVDDLPLPAPMPASEDGSSPLGDDPNDWYLKSEYAVECLSGACPVGELFIIPADHIIGVPLNKIVTNSEGS